MTPVLITQGDSPIVLGQPHGGTYVPGDVMARLNACGQALADTDWHIAQLYDGVVDGLTSVAATFHRYVIDANRDPAGASLYPGQNTTGLCPTTDFDGEPIWLNGENPSPDEIEARRQTFHAPYHAALAAELERVKAIHGFAVLYDCHSIRSDIPFLFQGQLLSFNIGTNDGTTCAPEIEAATVRICANAAYYEHVLNGRFKGGWTTRHYGRPAEGVHAIQMELAQRGYMLEAPPRTYDSTNATKLRHHLAVILHAISSTAKEIHQ